MRKSGGRKEKRKRSNVEGRVGGSYEIGDERKGAPCCPRARAEKKKKEKSTTRIASLPFRFSLPPLALAKTNLDFLRFSRLLPAIFSAHSAPFRSPLPQSASPLTSSGHSRQKRIESGAIAVSEKRVRGSALFPSLLFPLFFPSPSARRGKSKWKNGSFPFVQSLRSAFSITIRCPRSGQRHLSAVLAASGNGESEEVRGPEARKFEGLGASSS